MPQPHSWGRHAHVSASTRWPSLAAASDAHVRRDPPIRTRPYEVLIVTAFTSTPRTAIAQTPTFSGLSSKSRVRFAIVLVLAIELHSCVCVCVCPDARAPKSVRTTLDLLCTRALAVASAHSFAGAWSPPRRRTRRCREAPRLAPHPTSVPALPHPPARPRLRTSLCAHPLRYRSRFRCSLG